MFNWLKKRPLRTKVANHVHDMQVVGAWILFLAACFVGTVAVVVYKIFGG